VRIRWCKPLAGFVSGYDFDNVTDLIYDLHGKGKVAEKYWAYMEALAEPLVDRHWHRTESVAKALLEHGIIKGVSARISATTAPTPSITQLSDLPCCKTTGCPALISTLKNAASPRCE
jgi:hypothetical protein